MKQSNTCRFHVGSRPRQLTRQEHPSLIATTQHALAQHQDSQLPMGKVDSMATWQPVHRPPPPSPALYLSSKHTLRDTPRAYPHDGCSRPPVPRPQGRPLPPSPRHPPVGVAGHRQVITSRRRPTEPLRRRSMHCKRRQQAAGSADEPPSASVAWQNVLVLVPGIFSPDVVELPRRWLPIPHPPFPHLCEHK